MEKVYVIMDQDSELIGVATNLNAIKEVIENEYIDDDYLDIIIEKTHVGYKIAVIEKDSIFKYNAFYSPLAGGISDERI